MIFSVGVNGSGGHMLANDQMSGHTNDCLYTKTPLMFCEIITAAFMMD